MFVRCWDDTCIVYSELTGQTHLMGSFPALVVTLLKDGLSNSVQLSARIASTLQVEDDAKLLATIEETLADFERLGLVELNPV